MKPGDTINGTSGKEIGFYLLVQIIVFQSYSQVPRKDRKNLVESGMNWEKGVAER
jgi:hypothetical protein